MHSYSSADWEPFFEALIGGAASLAGLLFVAVSINLDRILAEGKFLSARAGETLAILVLIVVSSALALVPQSSRLLGWELLVLVVPVLVVTTWSQIAHRREKPDDPLFWHLARSAATAAATVPGSIAGLSLILHSGGGLYWLVPTALLGISGAVYSAWILLVKIVD